MADFSYPAYFIEAPLDSDDILKTIERIGRVCYKSEDKITHDSSKPFVKNLIADGHESVLEHVSFTVRFIVDRGVSHEIVRHRLASYSQESTRYCNYSDEKFENGVTFIIPSQMFTTSISVTLWQRSCELAEKAYFALLKLGEAPQTARAVLPTCVKTEIVMTANLREWRHFLKLRTAANAHPDMRAVTVPLLRELQSKIEIVFDDIGLERPLATGDLE